MAADIAAEFAQLLSEIATRFLLVLEVPGDGVLRLGVDIPRPFPEPLRTLEHPDFIPILRLIDPTPDSPEGSGARDWTDFADRMHFIADFFRAYQQFEALSTPPFSQEQVVVIKSGHRRRGPL